ncbi:MAG: Rieske 2Fe-2S domain-containing protein [Polyangiaceae bacterium]|nr:Rieske 2Fe-2S domain-containing protein [Polyangiaceae bacterium]
MVEANLPGHPSKLPPFPRGWYAIGLSEEFARGQVATRQLVGKELVVFRTRQGVVSVMDPICPHLGAHMGHGGTVEGESLRCPFHGFRFGVDGTCVATGYATNPPKVKARTWHVRENHGAVLVYFDPDGLAPTFEIPELDPTGFSPLRHKSYRFRGHPQDTTENSVDFGHLSIVHGYEQVKMRSELETRGAYLTAKYSMHRPVGLLGAGFGGVDAEFHVHVHGLGYSFVEVLVPKLGFETRNFVYATPVGEMDLELRIAISIRHLHKTPNLVRPLKLAAQIGPLRRLVEAALMRQAFGAYSHDVEQDFVIWKHKQFVPRPALALGDGPVMRYRRWAEQFYRPADLGRPQEGRSVQPELA